MDLPWKPFFLYPIRNGLKCNCFLKTLCIGNSLICFLFLPPLKVLHSVSIYYVFYLPSAPPVGDINAIICAEKWHSKGMGRKEPQTTTCCPFTPSFGDCSIGAEVCEKMLYCTAILLSCFTWGKWGFDPATQWLSSTFWIAYWKRSQSSC